MALLDMLQDPGNALGLSLLAAGSPTADPDRAGFGVRLNAAVQDATDKTLKQQLAASQLFAAKQKAQLLALGIREAGGDALPVPPGGPGAVLGAAPSQAQGGAVGGGGAVSYPVSSPGAVLGAQASPAPAAAPAASAGPSGGAGAAPGLFNPRTAAYLKLGGEADILPNIQAMQPKWEQHGGYWVDVNPMTNPNFKGGFTPQVTTSADGKTTVIGVDPAGNPIVSAARGSVDTFGAFEDRAAQAKSKEQESRQPYIGSTGREYSQSIYDAVRGNVPPAAGGAPAVAPVPGGAAPPPRAAIGPGASYATPGGLAGGNTAAAAVGQREVLEGELASTRQRLAQAQAAGDAGNVARAQSDIAGIQRELARLPGAPAGAAALPPPSPVVAQSGAPAAPAAPLIGPGAGAARTDFTNLPGQGIGVGGGMKHSGPEQAAQKAAQAGAQEQAKQQAEAEATTSKAMQADYPRVQADAKNAPTAIQLIDQMIEHAKKRKLGGYVSPGGTFPLIGGTVNDVSKRFNADYAAYDKARGQLLLMGIPGTGAGSGSGGNPTQAGERADVGVPEYHVESTAQLKALQDLRNQYTAAQIRGQILSPLADAGNGSAYSRATTTLNSSLTPAVANTVSAVLAMPKGPERDAAITEARKNKAAEAVLLEAIKAGAFK